MSSQTDVVLAAQSSPVGKLSPELLGEILSTYAASESFHLQSSLLPHWTVVTHVCRYWRDVGISMSFLWAKMRIDFGHLYRGKEVYDPGAYLEATKLLLARSGQAPLTVYCSGNLEVEIHALRLVLPHMHRVRSLRVDVSERLYQEFDGPITCPILQALHFGTSPKQNCDAFLSRLVAPNLRDLDVPHRRFSGTVAFPNTLTKLVFWETNVPVDVLAAIRYLTLLETLELCLHKNPSPTDPHTPPAAFPRLKALHIAAGNGLENWVGLLKLLQIPQRAYVRIILVKHTVARSNSLSTPIRAILDILVAPVQELNAITIDFRMIEFLADRGLVSGRSKGLQPDPKARLTIYFIPSGEDSESEMSDYLATELSSALSGPTSRHLTHLNICSRGTSLLPLLLSLPDIRTVTFQEEIWMIPELQRYLNRTILECMNPRRNHASESGPGDLQAPLTPLQRLDLTSVRFRGATFAEDSRSFMDELCEEFERRRMLGMEVKNLVLELCHGADAEIVEELGKHVGTVVVM